MDIQQSEGDDGILLSGLTPPIVCVCPTSGPGFSPPYVFLCFNC